MCKARIKDISPEKVRSQENSAPCFAEEARSKCECGKKAAGRFRNEVGIPENKSKIDKAKCPLTNSGQTKTGEKKQQEREAAIQTFPATFPNSHMFLVILFRNIPVEAFYFHLPTQQNIRICQFHRTKFFSV